MFFLSWLWEGKNRLPVLLISSAVILAIALIDWRTRPYVSLGFFYLFPIMMMARFLPRWALALVGLGCAVLSSLFSGLEWSAVRLGFEALALSGSGLFVAEVMRNRRLTLASQERLRVLVETSPAAILTVDSQGLIELANRAATELLAPREGKLIGTPIAAFLPELHYALRLDEGPQFRTALQCHAHRGTDGFFTADVWFSTYLEDGKPKLAAIIADVSEEASLSSSLAAVDRVEDGRIDLNQRERDILSFVVQGLANKEIADKMQLSESSVKNALQQLFSKTEVRTRSQLVRVALERYRDLI